MSYTIDFYRGQVQRETSFIRYATFVSLFPQLVAGPIERASHLLPQLQSPPQIRRDDVADGASLFVVGLFKKIALADYLALYVDPVYASPASYEAPALLLAKQVLTFSVVMLAWVFFRAQNTSDAWLILGRIFTCGWVDPAFPLLLLGLVFSIWLYQYLYESRFRRLLHPAPVRIVLVSAMVLYMAAFMTSGNHEFIYFRF